MFAGRPEPDAVLSKINNKVSEHYRIQVFFHAHLYGNLFQMVKDNKVQAEELLKKALKINTDENRNYMWQVARPLFSNVETGKIRSN